MTRISKGLILLASLAVAAFIALFVAAYLTPKSNKIATWKLGLDDIENAKSVWADNRDNTTNDAPTLDDLKPYFSDWATRHLFWTNGEVVDTDGGIYSIGRVGEKPSCLVDGRRVQR